MKRTEILRELNDLKDETYGSFQKSLIPNENMKKIIGVRTPDLRALAKKICKEGDYDAFLNDLPHEYFEEDQLHAFIISLEKNFEICIEKTEAFLPYIDNWATCDQLSPKVFAKNTGRLLPYIERWIASDHTYTIRYGIGRLMALYLDAHFDPLFPQMVSEIHSDEYYVNMMRAWYFATAMAKQYDQTIPYIEQKKLDPWTHNKTIQKCIESYRITDEQKAYLRTLRIQKGK